MGRILERTPGPQEWQTTIAPLSQPVGGTETLTVLRGSLAPDGAVLKRAAASPHLLRHAGPAVVVDGEEGAAARLDAMGEALTESHVIVLRGIGRGARACPRPVRFPFPASWRRGG